MSGVDLDFVAVLCSHLVESDLGLMKMMRILDGSEADRDSGGVAVGGEEKNDVNEAVG